MKTIKDSNGVLWQYDIADLLGRGGAGEVYRGRACDGTPVAVKVIEFGAGSRSFARRIHSREIEIGAKLNAATTRDHLVLHHGVAIDDTTISIIMPLATESLADRLGSPAARTMSIQDRVKVLRQIATGLQQIAEVGVVHRDLTTGNVLMVEGRWCLADFGISRDLTEHTSTLTRRGEGTFEYLAPEYRETGIATARTDLYALGVIAYELFAGRKPFLGPTAEDFLLQHAEHTPPPLPDDTPPLLERFIGRLLAKDPARRHGDARAVVEALDRFGKPLESDAQQRLASKVRIINKIDEADSIRNARWLREKQQILDRRTQACDDLDEMIAHLVELLRPVLEDEMNCESTSSELGAAWTLRWREWSLAIEVDFGESWPFERDWPLAAGVVSTTCTPRHADTIEERVANLLYVAEGTTGSWRYRTSAVAGSTRRAFPLATFWEVLDQESEPGIKVLPYVEEEPLTAERLVEVFDELLEH
ncbi:serine/threonine-protein kinase [Nocardia tengchongensis]